MKSKKLSLTLNLIVVLALLFGLVLPSVFVNTAADVAYAATSMSQSTADWTTQYTGNYYDNIDSNKTGLDLRAELESLITSTHHTKTTYSGTSKGSLAWMYDQSDYDPKNPNNLIMWYTGTSVSGTAWNREHVWPKNGDPSKAFDGDTKQNGGSDAHHLRPCDNQLNSTRGSLSFDEVVNGSIAKENGSTSYANLCYYNSSFFYPGKGYRGATARILFYMQTRWGGTSNYNLYFVDGAGNNKSIGKISTLLKWHLEEPPTDDEIRRNDAVASYQGNRNPFIDHPEYAAQIYCYTDGLNAIGGTTLSNKLLQVVDTYGNYNENRPDVESLTLNKTEFTITVGQTETLSVSVVPSNANANVNWSSSNTGVATVSNGVVTAKSAGSTTITATSVANPSVKATATVTVKGVTAIELIGKPEQTVYEAGQNFDPKGLTVKLIYSDGSAETYSSASDLAKFSWTDASTGNTALSANATKIKCKYGNVEVVSDWSIMIKAVTGIEIIGNPTKTTYDEGEPFDPTGLSVKIKYNDGTYQTVMSANELNTFSWVDSVTDSVYLDKNTTTIRCKYGSFSDVSSWSVTVRYVTALELSGTPTIKVYQTGQAFNPSGVIVKLVYSDDSFREFSTADDLAKFTWVDAATDSEVLVQTTTKIKVKYQELSQVGEWAVTVQAPPETISAFVNSVVAIENETTLKGKFNAIKAALNEYNELSATDKATDGAKGAYQILLQTIYDYNEAAAKQNEVMQNATQTGAYAISGVMLAAAALVEVFKRKFN